MNTSFTLIAGPCVIESKDLLSEVLETLLPIAKECEFDLIFQVLVILKHWNIFVMFLLLME
jgi:3-deoxy-D-manno-octulosonic acid (KDO) 8-phosphate synthase